MGKPSEQSSQVFLKGWLNGRRPRIHWQHNANGFERTQRGAEAARNAGVKRGAPDIEIYTPAPRFPWARGVAIELKRIGVKTYGKHRDEQAEFARELRVCGWLVLEEADETQAIDWLIALGY